jgi:ankyrin repeat protein
VRKERSMKQFLLFLIRVAFGNKGVSDKNDRLRRAVQQKEFQRMLDGISGKNAKLFLASYKGNFRTIQSLLAKGVDINAKINDVGTALMVAAVSGMNSSVPLLLCASE